VGRTASRWKRWVGEEVAQTMFLYVSKCKNHKIKGEIKKKAVEKL
jgi:hypothetical protein